MPNLNLMVFTDFSPAYTISDPASVGVQFKSVMLLIKKAFGMNFGGL